METTAATSQQNQVKERNAHEEQKLQKECKFGLSEYVKTIVFFPIFQSTYCVIQFSIGPFIFYHVNLLGIRLALLNNTHVCNIDPI